MSGTVLHFSDDMRKENIKSLSWYLLKKYLEGESQCPVLLNVLTGESPVVLICLLTWTHSLRALAK